MTAGIEVRPNVKNSATPQIIEATALELVRGGPAGTGSRAAPPPGSWLVSVASSPMVRAA